MALLMLVACGGDDASTQVDAPTGHGTDAPTVTDGTSSTADAPGGVGEPSNLTGMTLYHNQVRAMVQTSPALPALMWDPELASYAATWAAKCQDSDGDGLIDHDPNRTNVAGYSYIGENIYASSGTATAKDAVDLWAAEGANFHIASNTCDAGKVCGHYTQLVWRKTLNVGCALQNCPGLKYPSSIVCDYGPGGNFNGESPY